MALYTIGDTHLSLGSDKPMDVFGGAWEGYVEKLAEIFRRHEIRSVTVARMEVPCCGGTVAIVQEALKAAGKALEINIKTIGIDGEIQ